MLDTPNKMTHIVPAFLREIPRDEHATHNTTKITVYVGYAGSPPEKQTMGLKNTWAMYWQLFATISNQIHKQWIVLNNFAE